MLGFAGLPQPTGYSNKPVHSDFHDQFNLQEPELIDDGMTRNEIGNLFIQSTPEGGGKILSTPDLTVVK